MEVPAVAEIAGMLSVSKPLLDDQPADRADDPLALGQLGAAAGAVRRLLPVGLCRPSPSAACGRGSAAAAAARRDCLALGPLVAQRPVDQLLDQLRAAPPPCRPAGGGRRPRECPTTIARTVMSETWTAAGEWSKLWRIIASNASEARSRCATPAAPRVSDSTAASLAAPGSRTTSSMNTVSAASSRSRKSPCWR